ncbi:MAG: hypothetical protein F2799_03035 [Actinobacteria bacterium]|nr:hypothetical protein [Actinomycetota bacterium]
MAEDQRYCLSCGSRRAEKGVPFSPQTVATDTAASGGKQAITPALATAIVCLSVLFLGTGVLVGRSAGGSQQVASSAPQVVTVGATGTDGTAAGATGAAGSKAAKKGSGAAPSAVQKGAKVLSSAAVASATDCKGLTPTACGKKLAKLPKTISTPGTPPPIDHKAPAGGGGAQTWGN